MTKHVMLPIMMLCMLAGACTTGNKVPAASTGADTVAQVAVPTFEADSAMRYLSTQVAFGPRVPGSKAHSECGDYLVDLFHTFGADTVIEQRGSARTHDGSTIPVRNIFARYNAAAPTRVLLLAHWDCRPWADEDPVEANRTKPVPGANDGASGVAVIMEIARQLQQQMPAIGVDMLLTDAEDSGVSGMGDEDSWCLGTQQWVKQMPYTASTLPTYAVLLDMVGGKGARFHREYFSDAYASAIVDRVWAAAKVAGQDSRFVNAPGGPITDDHIYLNRAGIPAIDIIESQNAVTGGFPETWHTLADDVPAIDPSSLKAVGQTLLQLIYSEQ